MRRHRGWSAVCRWGRGGCSRSAHLLRLTLLLRAWLASLLLAVTAPAAFAAASASFFAAAGL
ncbi:MAG TPA: hypothetical protein VJM32_04910, partial [Candidatus Saccharimonadales bacterium]|nr:hypothetical protein [Candidatus Saccharimonadales bacterium]